jgi:hypothetical protein
MSIGLWKTVLGLAKALAVLVILVSGFLFWQHRQRMAVPADPPNFAPDIRTVASPVARIDGLSIALGRFQNPSGPTPEAKKPEELPDFTTELNKLCEITDAIVVWGLYVEGGIVPAIIIRWKQRPPGEQGDTKTVRWGQALIERPNPARPADPLPHRYKFVGCERDPENPGWTYFLFDVNCDGKDIQRARWKLEQPAKELATSAEPSAAGGPVSTKDMYIGPAHGAAEPEAPVPTTPEPVVTAPVAPPPPPEPVTMVEAPDTLFQEEGGTWVTTDEGAEYLERNYERLVEETRTSTYRDRDGRAVGVRIVGIKSTSVANQFDIRKDDVILKVNGIPVTTQSEAVKVVKDQLSKKATIITVELLRRGNTLVKRFDSRDPATRRAAQKFRR